MEIENRPSNSAVPGMAQCCVSEFFLFSHQKQWGVQGITKIVSLTFQRKQA